jgi:HK97 family phage major capsid protein
MVMTKINEYISTADGVAGTLLIPKLIMPELIREQEKALIPREMAKWVKGPSQIQGSSFTVNLETPNTMSIRQVGEGAEVPLDNIDFETVTFTPVKYGVAVRITREMKEDAQFDIKSINIGTAGKRFAENETNLVLGQLDTANTTVGGGAAVTLANVAEAIFNVEDQDYNPSDYLIGNEVHQDLMNIDTFVDANKAGNTTLMQQGFVGTIFGLNVARYSTNAGTNAVATSSYVFDRSQAYAIAIKRDITMENVTMPTFDMEGAVLTQRIDIKALRTKAISKITSS